MHEKAPHAISEECQHGCAIYEDGTEFFEITKHFDAKLWRWPSQPPGFRAAMTAAYECMSAVAISVLEALCLALEMDVQATRSLLDPVSTDEHSQSISQFVVVPSFPVRRPDLESR